MENWLGLHPSSHSCRNILSIILRPSLTREMTTPHSTTPNHTTVSLSEMATPHNTILNHTSQYHTTLLVSTEDPSTLKHEEYISNGRGSWPVIAGGDRTNDQLVTELWSCQCTIIPCYTWIFPTVSRFILWSMVYAWSCQKFHPAVAISWCFFLYQFANQSTECGTVPYYAGYQWPPVWSYQWLPDRKGPDPRLCRPSVPAGQASPYDLCPLVLTVFVHKYK